jgi:hypothetical protein
MYEFKDTMPWAPFLAPVFDNIAITQTTVELNFPDGRYSVVPPSAFITINGAPTNVSWYFKMSQISEIGEVFTGIVFTFQPGAVGKQANIWIMGV